MNFEGLCPESTSLMKEMLIRVFSTFPPLRKYAKNLCLINLVGNWISVRCDVERHIVSFYENLYTIKLYFFSRYCTRAFSYIIFTTEAELLKKSI